MLATTSSAGGDDEMRGRSAPRTAAEQLLEPPLPLDQRQVAQVVAVLLDQIEGGRGD